MKNLIQQETVFQTPRQLAKRYGLSYGFVVKMIREGRMPALRISARCYRVHPAEADAALRDMMGAAR
jgi:excisionase family DNA binding protein